MATANEYTAAWIKEHMNLLKRGNAYALFSEWEDKFKTNSYNDRLAHFLSRCYSMEDYVSLFGEDLPYRSFNHCPYREIVFPKPVRVVEANCFSGNHLVRKIDFSNSHSIRIDEDAFSSCLGLEEVILGKPEYSLIDATSTIGCPNKMVFVFDGTTDECYDAIEVAYHSCVVKDHSVRFKCSNGILEI